MVLQKSLTSIIPCAFLTILIFPNTIHLSLAHNHHHHHHESNAIFIFGDSILDAGNNNYINTTTLDQADFWPYGITFFHYPTGRFSDGRLISDFIAEYANLPLIPPFLQPNKPRFDHRHHQHHGVNFASAGAGALVETFQGDVIDLHMQLKNYKEMEKQLKNKYGDAKKKRILRRAVYLFSIGINDYTSLFFTNSTLLTTYTKPQYVDMVISNFTSVIHEIYNIGGRKLAILNLPAVGCAPGLRILDANGECLDEVTDYVKLHNNALLYVLQKLAKQLPGFKYSLYDFYTATLQRVNHPSHYGYKEGKIACCGTGKYRGVLSCGGKRPVKEFELCRNINDHIFWDSIHMTEKTYQQIAQEIWTNVNSIHAYGSYIIKDLFFLP